MIDYLALKAVHVTCVAVSYGLFLVRGVWMIRDSAMLERRWVKILPHVNDTLLLAAAIALAWMLGQYPFVHGWLTAKSSSCCSAPARCAAAGGPWVSGATPFSRVARREGVTWSRPIPG